MNQILLTWSVYNYNINANRIELFNIFCHSSFRKDVTNDLKEYANKSKFAENVRRKLQYYFHCHTEFELTIELTDDNKVFLIPWCVNPTETRIEVTNESIFDWLGFAKEHISKQGYEDVAKIDIYDQVMFQFDKFIDYVWNCNKK